MALMSKPTDDPKVSRWWWRPLRTWVYGLVDPLWAAFRGENSDDIALTNVTSINGVSSAELAVLDGLSATTSELNQLSGLTASVAELNKADRTQPDGVAEASRNVVLDANGDLFGKRYDISLSTLNAIVGEKPFLRFGGIDSYVSRSNDANLNFGAKTDFSLECLMRTSIIPGNYDMLINKGHNVDESYFLELLANGKVFAGLDDSATAKNQTSSTTVDDGEWHHILAIYDRDGNLQIYIDGRADGTPIDISSVGDVDYASKPLAIGISSYNLSSNVYEGDIALVRIWNRVLAADEIKALASGASVGYADAGAGQADLVINGDDWTGATGSTPPNSWSDSGGASATYIIRNNTGVANMDVKVLEIDVSGSGSKTLSQGVFQTGKRYRVTFAYRNLDGSGGATKVSFGSSANSTTLQNTTISGDGIIFTQDVLADGPDLAFEVTTVGSLQIDAVQVVQIGCVLALRPDGIGGPQWQDASGNELHGQVNGAIPLNLPSNHLAAYVKKGITADTTLTGVVPAGYRIRSIIVEETAGNAITGGLKIGTSAGGTQVVNAQAVGAGALLDCALGTRLFSLTTAQTLYVEDVTAWNSASIDLYLEMERIK